jgi:hypothetical protein
MNGSSARGKVVATAFAVMLAAVLVAGGSAASAMKAWGDPAGDANGGPDITKISISDSGGLVVFKFTVHGFAVAPGGTVQEAGFESELDTTGDGHPDYRLIAGATADDHYSDVVDVHTHKQVPLTPTIRYARTGDVHTFTMSSADLGGATRFDFYAVTATWDADGKITNGDDAPDAGLFGYELTSVKPVIGTPRITPLVPVPGRALTVSLPVTRSDGFTLVPSGTVVSLDLTLDGKPIAHSAKLTAGAASVRVTVPPSAAGKTLTARMAVQFAGHSVTRLSNLRVPAA